MPKVEKRFKSRCKPFFVVRSFARNRHNIPDALFNITLAQFHFRFVHTGQGRQCTLTFEVSHPKTSNLKSCRQEDLRLIGEKYLRRWGIDRA